MSIFNEFNKKEKPVFTGLKFGFGSGGGGSSGLTGGSGGVKFSDSTYTYHIFVQGDTSDFTANVTISNCHVVCVGGGGGGANGQGGGGGGSSVGHYVDGTLPAGTYPVSIGSGGATAPNSPPYSVSGSKGGDSTFGGTTVYGGGGGLRNNYGYEGNPSQPGLGGNAGGGGGGSLFGNLAADGVVTSQPGGPLGFTIYGGNNGAPAAQQGDGSGGGGGGAGGASPGPSQPRGGTASPGGAGKAIPQFPGPGIYPIMPSPLQSTLGTAWRDALGPTGLFGGGGGGGDDNSNSGGGAGGPGGGGHGGDDNNTPKGGVDGTGGGAGDRGQPSDPGNPGGGDGIVIVRYPV